MMTACKPLSPAELAQKRKEEAKKQREADRKWAKTPPDLKRYYKRMERVIALRMKHYHEQRDKEWAEGDMRHARSDEMLHHVLDVVLDDNTPDSVQASPH